MYAALDTNILISALRSRVGASYRILRLIRSGEIRIALSVSLAMEYEDVASRPGMVPSLTPPQIKSIIDGLCVLARHQQIYFNWRPHLPDAGDDMVLELALAAGAPYIITHNIKHFRGSESLNIRAITAAQALTLINP